MHLNWSSKFNLKDKAVYKQTNKQINERDAKKIPYSEKFWRRFYLAMGQIGLFGKDLIWR